MSAPKPKIEYQIRCNDDTHRTHRYATSNPACQRCGEEITPGDLGRGLCNFCRMQFEDECAVRWDSGTRGFIDADEATET